MTGLLTPARRRGVEWLDVTDDATLQQRSHRDITLANRWLGGTRAVRREVAALLSPRASATLLDVGTGTGDIPAALVREAGARGARLDAIGLDGRVELLSAQRGPSPVVCGDARSLPFATGAFDVVIASQVLHHFMTDDAVQLVRELHRVARRRVVIADLRRSWVAAAGFWLVSFPLGFHPVSRHDGVVSILRGFDEPELRDLVQQATGVRPLVRRHAGWRLTATWNRE